MKRLPLFSLVSIILLSTSTGVLAKDKEQGESSFTYVQQSTQDTTPGDSPAASKRKKKGKRSAQGTVANSDKSPSKPETRAHKKLRETLEMAKDSYEQAVKLKDPALMKQAKDTIKAAEKRLKEEEKKNGSA